jgi:hypothetical protein
MRQDNSTSTRGAVVAGISVTRNRLARGIPKIEEVTMRSFISVAAAGAALSLLLSCVGASAAAVSARKGPELVWPDASHTPAYFFKWVCGNSSITIPTLNGLSGTIPYDAFGQCPWLRSKVWTAWGTFRNPPAPSNGGTIVAYIVLEFLKRVPFISQTLSQASITYAGLNPSKTYSIDMWYLTRGPSEVRLYSAGSPSNGTLTFEAPYNWLTIPSARNEPNPNDILICELVQNP